MLTLDQTLTPALEQRRQQQRYRKRAMVESPQGVLLNVNGKHTLSFCSNDYLGLANHPNVIRASQQAIEHYGLGSGASHLVCGHSYEHHQLERELAEFTGRERALLFSTGYMANMGAINALVGRGDAVFQDRLNHASLIDGGLLSQAEFIRYRHNSIDELAQRLAASDAERKLLVVDGVFSMDGDLADIPQLSALAKQHNAWLMVDDAHGFGCLGEQGKGTVNYFTCSQDDVPILMGTLGKAFGTFGAFVAGSETLIESLIQFARPYIYTTALPPAVAAATRASLTLLQTEDGRREKLATLIQGFRQGCADLGLPLMASLTPIQPILLGSDTLALQYSEYLADRGVWVTAIRPPTVPQGTARLRVTLCAEHTEAHLQQLLDALAGAKAHWGTPA